MIKFNGKVGIAVMRQDIKDLKVKTYTFVIALFIAVLLISNVASTKLFGLWGTNTIIDGGTILFPFAYILGDVITEVYGFKKARFIIFCGFVCMALMSLTFYLVQLLPPAEGWENQAAFESILGLVPRIMAGSLVAYLAGELLNSYVMTKLKEKTKGSLLWMRAIGSTVAGALVDTVVFSLIAFYGVIPGGSLFDLILTVYIIKILVEIAVLPITYAAVGRLKTIEGVK